MAKLSFEYEYSDPIKLAETLARVNQVLHDENLAPHNVSVSGKAETQAG